MNSRSKPPLTELVGRDPDNDGEILPHCLSGSRDNLQHETGAVFFRSAVGILPLVGKRREELIQEVAVGAVDLNGVEPG